jgi:hypothetical protein
MPHDRLIPLDELLQILTDAGLRHQRAFYETSLSKLVANGTDPLADLSTIHELAAALDIPEERVNEVLSLRYPEPAEQLEVLEAAGAVATTRAVARSYQAALLGRLRKALPSQTFDAVLERADRDFDQPYLPVKWRRDYMVRILLVTEAVVPVRSASGWRNLFGLVRRGEVQTTRRDEVVLGTISIGNEFLPNAPILRGRGGDTARYHRAERLFISVIVSSGVFLKVAAPTLDELRTRFDRHNGIARYEIAYDYIVE